MPEMDGYELSEIIRRDFPDVHIIIFTADLLGEVRMKLAKMEIYDILNKPFFPEEMLAALLKVIKMKNI
jgi:CheY-like chemotaxis protein